LKLLPGWNTAVTAAVSVNTDNASSRVAKVRLPSSLARDENPTRWLILNCGLPCLPRLVVIITTPLVALEP
jgi:hypothetical protein